MCRALDEIRRFKRQANAPDLGRFKLKDQCIISFVNLNMNLSKSSIRTERSFTRRKQQDAAINISAANLLTPMGNQPSLRGSRIS